MYIHENIAAISNRIDKAILIAVTKSQPIHNIKLAVDAGVKDIAENRVQEAEEKYSLLSDYFKENNVRFHLIGTLQKNKVKHAVRIFDIIQSVDSLELAVEIDKWAKEIGKVQDVLIQVNIGDEPQKHGFSRPKVDEAIRQISEMKSVKIKGFMCIAPQSEDPEKARPYFKEMKQIFDRHNFEYLSMGMSDDYRVALEEGSNMLRIGRGIFGERNN